MLNRLGLCFDPITANVGSTYEIVTMGLPGKYVPVRLYENEVN
jgi:hypothetical protein